MLFLVPHTDCEFTQNFGGDGALRIITFLLCKCMIYVAPSLVSVFRHFCGVTDLRDRIIK
jgi:hypothetical protein